MRQCNCRKHRKYGPRTETAEERQLRSDMHEITQWRAEKDAHDALIAAFNNPAVSPIDKEDLLHLKWSAPSKLRFSCAEFPCLKTDANIGYAKSLDRCLFPSSYLEQQFRFEESYLIIETHQESSTFTEIGRFPLSSLRLELEVRENPHKEGCIKKDLIVHVRYHPEEASLDSSCL